MSEQIQRVWEFRAGCHNVIDDDPAAARVAAVAERPDLSDDCYVQFDGDPRKYRVGELRAAATATGPTIADEPDTETSDAKLKTFANQLRKADLGFIRIIWTDTSRTVGKGIYLTQVSGIPEPRSRPFTFDGDRVTSPTGKPKTLEESSWTPLSAYQKDLDALRAASATPETTFEAQYKAQRAAELAAEPERLSQQRAARGLLEPQLRHAAGAPRYPIPDPYKDAVEKLRERDARALVAKEGR